VIKLSLIRFVNKIKHVNPPFFWNLLCGILKLNKIPRVFDGVYSNLNDYQKISAAKNYQPFHRFDNFSDEHRSNNFYNLLFKEVK